MRSGGTCGRCGAKRHGKRRHVSGSAAFTVCARCQTALCEKHATWDSTENGWVCGTQALCLKTQRR